MTRAPATLAALAAFACIIVGGYETTRWFAALERAPRWAALLAPLEAMPVPAGATVALSIPAELAAPGTAKVVVYEAAWRRPDLRWALLSQWPAGHPLVHLVALRDAPVPPGWSEAWHGGELRLLRKVAP